MLRAVLHGPPAGLGELVDMRALAELVERQLPDRRETGIAERQAAVGAEHRDRLGQRVDGRSLDVEQRLVEALEPELLGDVLEDIDHAAIGARRRRDHIDRAPVWQVPGIVLARGCEIVGGAEVLGAPGMVVGLGRQQAFGAQAVEDLAFLEAGPEPVGIEAPELGVGLVELHQLPRLVEDRDRRRKGIDETAEVLDATGERRQGVLGSRHEVAGAAVGIAGTRSPRTCRRRW